MYLTSWCTTHHRSLHYTSHSCYPVRFRYSPNHSENKPLQEPCQTFICLLLIHPYPLVTEVFLLNPKPRKDYCRNSICRPRNFFVCCVFKFCFCVLLTFGCLCLGLLTILSLNVCFRSVSTMNKILKLDRLWSSSRIHDEKSINDSLDVPLLRLYPTNGVTRWCYSSQLITWFN